MLYSCILNLNYNGKFKYIKVKLSLFCNQEFLHLFLSNQIYFPFFPVEPCEQFNAHKQAPAHSQILDYRTQYPEFEMNKLPLLGKD